MSILEHILLFIFLFCFFSIWGIYFYNIKSKYKFWLLAFFPIIAYSLILGSRYGWGPDYFSYKYRLEKAFIFPEEQIGFRWINQFINILGFNYVGGYIIYSLIFIICAFVLIRSFGKSSKYMYAFIIPSTMAIANYSIRQGLSFSFIFLAIFFFNKKKWFWLIFSLIICFSIHTANLIVAILISIIYLTFNKPISWKISIPLYLFFTFFFDVSKVGFIADYLTLINLDNHFQSYIDNADVWFGAEGAEDKYAQGFFALVTSSLFYISLIFLGFWSLKIRFNHLILYLYNTMVIGIVFYRIIFLYEVLRRIAEPMILFYFVILGYIIYVFKQSKKQPLLLKKQIIYNNYQINSSIMISLYHLGLFFIILFLILYWGRFIFLNPDANFFWNI